MSHVCVCSVGLNDCSSLFCRLRELSPAHATLISVQQLKTQGHKPNELPISFSFADMER